MRSAFDGPTLGNSIRCSSVAVLRLILPASALRFDFFATVCSSAGRTTVPTADGCVPVRAGDAGVAGDVGVAGAAEAAGAVIHVPPIAMTRTAIAATVPARRASLGIEIVMAASSERDIAGCG